MTIRRLTRSRTEGKVAGVCVGIANYFDIDVVLVRAHAAGVNPVDCASSTSAAALSSVAIDRGS